MSAAPSSDPPPLDTHEFQKSKLYVQFKDLPMPFLLLDRFLLTKILGFGTYGLSLFSADDVTFVFPSLFILSTVRYCFSGVRSEAKSRLRAQAGSFLFSVLLQYCSSLLDY
jgi:hypothetical protein